MATFLFALVCLVVFIGIPGALYWLQKNEKNSKKFGPSSLDSDSPNVQGTFIWNSGLTSLFGSEEKQREKRKQNNKNGLKLVQKGDHLTGTFEGTGINGRPYHGEIYLSCQRGKLEGRYKMWSRETTYPSQIVHGVLGKNEAHLFFGLPKDGKKYSNQLQAKISDYEINWHARRGKIHNVFLAESGHLKVDLNQLSGNILSYREPQNLDVEVRHQAERAELVWIATLLCSSEVLRIQ